jgi:hypothetical protein
MRRRKRLTLPAGALAARLEVANTLSKWMRRLGVFLNLAADEASFAKHCILFIGLCSALYWALPSFWIGTPKTFTTG